MTTQGSFRPPRHVVLVGLMGSGKTTVGRRLAARLGWPVSDSDDWLRATEGLSGRELREQRGTHALRTLEARHLLDALADPDATPSVICAAASIADDPACLDALRDPTLLVAWLRATPATAACRFDDQAHRPRYGEDVATFLADQALDRDPRFRTLGALELDTDTATPDDLAGTILDAVRARA